MDTVNLLDGKYTITYDNGVMEFMRHGESWPAGNELRHTGVVAALVQRVIELESNAASVSACMDMACTGCISGEAPCMQGDKSSVEPAVSKNVRTLVTEIVRKAGPMENQDRLVEDLVSMLNKTYDIDTEESFFNMDGVAQQPDIEEDIGRLIVEIDRAFQFMVTPPPIELTEAQFKHEFDTRVAPVLGKITTILAQRIMVKHPFNIMADMFFNAQNGRFGGEERLLIAAGTIESTNDQLMRACEKDHYIGTKEGAAEVLACLASMTTSLQNIMNLYGWSWDDVKLKARRQFAEVEGL